jgi:hypothetical protein
LYVAPLVFAFAPIVNVILSLIVDRVKTMPHPLFFVGLLLAVGGASLVMIYKPAAAHAAGAGPATKSVVSAETRTSNIQH